MLKTITLLARLSSQHYPVNGEHATLVLDARGADEQFVLVERGFTSDTDISFIREDYCFVRLIQGTRYYRIDKVIQIDNHLLTAELISIPKNGTKE
jgi:hypothetical protein